MENVKDDQLNLVVYNYLRQLDSKFAQDFKKEVGGVNKNVIKGFPSLGDVVKFFKKGKPTKKSVAKKIKRHFVCVCSPVKTKNVSSKKAKINSLKTKLIASEIPTNGETANSEFRYVEDLEDRVDSEDTEDLNAQVSIMSSFLEQSLEQYLPPL